MDRRYRQLEDLPAVQGQRVLVRVDFNVPLHAGTVADSTRIEGALPTVRWLMERGARVVLMSHLGRPRGQVVPDSSLAPVAGRLEELLGAPVSFAPDCIGPAAAAAVDALAPGAVLLLENLRFHAGEEQGEAAFAEALAELGDLYVNDAFGAAHRAHASVTGVPALRPAAAGRLMARELEVLGGLLEAPAAPFVAIIGGAKVKDKIAVLSSLMQRCQALIIGGGMAHAFLACRGQATGASLVEGLEHAGELLEQAIARGVQVMLPEDHVAAREISPTAEIRIMSELEEGWMGLDVGPATRERFSSFLKVLQPRTLLWNGPVGVFECAPFATGTRELALAVAELESCVTVVGGGETVMAVRQAGVADRITHVSTGGGASLELLQGLELPGVAALTAHAS